jgi:predicted nucleic acid-binding protein
MSHVLVDSNVVLDVFTEDSEWFDWSSSALLDQAARTTLAINPIIYAEISVRFERIEELEVALPKDWARLPLPWEAGFLAGKCYRQYRLRGGTRESTLPDFFIGAHAAIAGIPLITRDGRRYRSYFPKLHVISPDT